MYEKEDKEAMDLALITAKQVFELFILILCGVVIGKIKMVNEPSYIFCCSIYDY